MIRKRETITNEEHHATASPYYRSGSARLVRQWKRACRANTGWNVFHSFLCLYYLFTGRKQTVNHSRHNFASVLESKIQKVVGAVVIENICATSDSPKQNKMRLFQLSLLSSRPESSALLLFETAGFLSIESKRTNAEKEEAAVPERLANNLLLVPLKILMFSFYYEQSKSRRGLWCRWHGTLDNKSGAKRTVEISTWINWN